MKKYKLTHEKKEIIKAAFLYRVQALKNFGKVKAGDLGGWIEKEENLSQEGDCWVYDESWICGDAFVYDDAKIFDHARVFGNAKVSGNAEIYRGAWVYERAEVYGRVKVWDSAHVCGDARVFGNAQVSWGMIIHGGWWNTNPLYIRGAREAFVTSSPTTIEVNDKDHSIEWWKKNYRKVVEKKEYTIHQMEEFKLILDMVISWLEHQGEKLVETVESIKDG